MQELCKDLMRVFIYWRMLSVNWYLKNICIYMTEENVRMIAQYHSEDLPYSMHQMYLAHITSELMYITNCNIFIYPVYNTPVVLSVAELHIEFLYFFLLNFDWVAYQILLLLFVNCVQLQNPRNKTRKLVFSSFPALTCFLIRFKIKWLKVLVSWQCITPGHSASCSLFPFYGWNTSVDMRATGDSYICITYVYI